MTANEALARFYRAQGHAHNAHADYFKARNAKSDRALERVYRGFAQDFFRMAAEVEAEAMEDAA